MLTPTNPILVHNLLIKVYIYLYWISECYGNCLWRLLWQLFKPNILLQADILIHQLFSNYIKKNFQNFLFFLLLNISSMSILKSSGIKNCIYFAFNVVDHSPNVLHGTDKPDVHCDDSNHGKYIHILQRNMMAVAKLICLV